MKIAVLSDIHGNSWALTSVLRDLEKYQPDLIVNLGDSLYGPLNPIETLRLLVSNQIISISGNQDRFIIENLDKETDYQTLAYVINELDQAAFDWIAGLPKEYIHPAGIYMCHGTPKSDTTYLLEDVSNIVSKVNVLDKIESYLSEIKQRIVLCGHSHTPRFVQYNSRKIINPGSVGLPAYDDDLPVFHKMENYHHHAHYAIIEFSDEELAVQQISVPYTYEMAVECALKNNRPDWAKWLKTGRA